jgi:hypothetical protein
MSTTNPEARRLPKLAAVDKVVALLIAVAVLGLYLWSGPAPMGVFYYNCKADNQTAALTYGMITKCVANGLAATLLCSLLYLTAAFALGSNLWRFLVIWRSKRQDPYLDMRPIDAFGKYTLPIGLVAVALYMVVTIGIYTGAAYVVPFIRLMLWLLYPFA